MCLRVGERKAAAAPPPSICKPFARVSVNSAELARCFGEGQCFMSSPHLPPPHIFLLIRWRACDLSAVGNIWAFCHKGIKAFLLARHHGEGVRKTAGSRCGRRILLETKGFKVDVAKTFCFCPFACFLFWASSFCSVQAGQPGRSSRVACAHLFLSSELEIIFGFQSARVRACMWPCLECVAIKSR